MEVSPARVIAHYLVNRGVCTLAQPGVAADTWPVSWSGEADKPNNVVTVYNTAGVKHGRLMPSGKVQKHFGIQVRVRGTTEEVAQAKLSTIMTLFDEQTVRWVVLLAGKEYLIHSINAVGEPMPLGKPGGSKRNVFTMNYLTSIREANVVGLVTGQNGYPIDIDGAHLLSNLG